MVTKGTHFFIFRRKPCKLVGTALKALQIGGENFINKSLMPRDRIILPPLHNKLKTRTNEAVCKNLG